MPGSPPAIVWVAASKALSGFCWPAADNPSGAEGQFLATVGGTTGLPSPSPTVAYTVTLKMLSPLSSPAARPSHGAPSHPFNFSTSVRLEYGSARKYAPVRRFRLVLRSAITRRQQNHDLRRMLSQILPSCSPDRLEARCRSSPDRIPRSHSRKPRSRLLRILGRKNL